MILVEQSQLSYPSHRCRGRGNCRVDIKVKGRRTCQRCRYDRCLQAGMRPDLVLSQSEKEERFKKYYDRRRIREEDEDGGGLVDGDAAMASSSPVLGQEAGTVVKTEPRESDSTIAEAAAPSLESHASSSTITSGVARMAPSPWSPRCSAAR